MTMSKKEATEIQKEIAHVEAALLAVKERVASLATHMPEVEAIVGCTYINCDGEDRALIAVGGAYWLLDAEGVDAVGHSFGDLLSVRRYMNNREYTPLDLKE